MARLDIDADLRWFRSLPREQLTRRPDADLQFLAGPPSGGQALLLDTCVYIDALQGRLPGIVTELIAVRQVNHSACAIQELMHGVGMLDPQDRRTPVAVDGIAALVKEMRPHRVFAPDIATMARAALLSGLLCRIQNYGGDHRKRALMDATLFLQAAKLGLATVTRNIGDFDLLLQLIPRASVHLYRV